MIFENRVFIRIVKVSLAFTFERFSPPFRVTANTLSKMRNHEGTRRETVRQKERGGERRGK